MKRIMLAALMLLGLNLTAFAQGFTGTVSGRVLDQQQAAVANAAVILKNEATGVERRTATDGEGDYVFNAAAPGNAGGIINKHLEATGGKEALEKIKSRVATGTFKLETYPEQKLAIMSESPNLQFCRNNFIERIVNWQSIFPVDED